jgi:hypothetical protein
MKSTTSALNVPLIFLWVGFVSAISFMEAWLKFTAPGVSLSAGLAIGQVVFGTLNKVELTIAFLLVLIVLNSGPLRISREFFIAFAITVLLAQTFFVLPFLSARIDVYLSGGTPKPSRIHLLYITLEILKVSALVIYGLNNLKK